MPRPVLLMSSATGIVLALAPILASAPASAAEPDVAEPADASRYAMIDTITVTATRRPIQAFSFPGSVSVIDRGAIDALNPSSASDLFRQVPGVQFSGGPRRTGETPSIRGMGGDEVLVLYDGVRQNFSSGHDGRFFIEPDLLKAAEVVRGPASALYGSGALGGVLNFRLADAGDFLDPGKTAGFRVKAGYQGVDDEAMLGGTAFARSLDGRFDGIANLTYRNSGDISLGNGMALQSDDEIVSGLLKGSMRLADGLTATVTGITFDNDAEEPNDGQDVLATDRVKKEVTSRLLSGKLAFNPSGSDLIDGSVTLYGNKTSVDEAEIASPRVVSRDVTTLGIAVDNSSRIGLGGMNALTFTYGGEYYRDKQRGADNMTASGTRGGVPDATAKTLGLYIQAELDLATPAGQFILIPGLRYDDFRDRHDGPGGSETSKNDATSPKIALTWKPMPWLMGFANYGEAFRAPSYNEIYADDIHFTIPLGPGLEAANSFIANPDLKPESSDTWEAGGGVDFADILGRNDKFTAKASYYRSDVDDLIDLEVDFAFSPSCFDPGIPGICTAGTSRYSNTRSARLHGFELEAAYDHPRLYLMASYSSIDGKDRETGDYVGVLTPDRLHLDGGVKVPEIDSRLGARLEAARHFDKVDDPSEERAGYHVVYLYYVWAPSAGALKGLRIDLGVDNVGDTHYERVFAGVPAPGRNYKIAASWTGSF
jgi:hemoglobin/transferrin/lactoferrin receptor protein